MLARLYTSTYTYRPLRRFREVLVTSTDLSLTTAGCLAVSVLCSPAASASYASGVEPYSHDLSWYDTWAREQQAVERSTSSSRKLLQLGGGYWTSPAKHNGSTSCEVHLVGTNKQWGVKSASINCTTTDSAWLRSKTGNVKVTSLPLTLIEARSGAYPSTRSVCVPFDGWGADEILATLVSQPFASSLSSDANLSQFLTPFPPGRVFYSVH